MTRYGSPRPSRHVVPAVIVAPAVIGVLAVLLALLPAPESGAGESAVVSGYVTDAATGRPIVGEPVYIYTATSRVGQVRTDRRGWYEIFVAPGDYYVVTATAEHLNELYDNVPCPDACPVTSGTRVRVGPGDAQSDVDFRLRMVRGAAP